MDAPRASRSSQLAAELADAREQLAATAGVLRVIAESPGDAQPVFDAIVSAGVRLFRGAALAISRAEGGQVHSLAIAEDDPERAARWRKVFPFPLSREFIHGAAILERRVVDVPDVLETGGQFEAGKRNLAPSGYRAMTVVPLMSAGQAIGAIAVVRMTPGALSPRQIALLQAFADQAVIAIENTRLTQDREARNRELAEALEQQTATGEILRVIARSPTDVQPVFQTIADAALRLCDASVANVLTFDGTLLHVGALAGLSGAGLAAVHTIFPRRPARDTAAGMAVLNRDVFTIEDVLADPEYACMAGPNWSVRSVLGVPLLRQGEPIGALAICRPVAGPFADKLVALLRTFADQAVIAIENARLFSETQQALDHQMAISEVLRVISQSPIDVAPVFEAILDSASRLLGTSLVAIFRYDGRLVHQVAVRNWSPEAVEEARRFYPGPPSLQMISGRVILTGQLQIQDDALADPQYDQRLARLGLWRRMVGAPLLKDGLPVGAIVVAWRDPGRTPQRQIDLLKIFADQAVIAIENTRAFTEREERNRELAEALEQQKATGEILQVISRSPTDVQPVFDAIAERSLALCGGKICTVARFDGALIHVGAFRGSTPRAMRTINSMYPLPPGPRTVISRTVRDGRPVLIPDVDADPDYGSRDGAQQAGYRSLLGVPMMRAGEVIGAIGIARAEVGLFPDKQVKLLQTFADQAVIAIENTRLFNEREARNRELAEALEQQQATGEILRVIARSPTDVQPVFDTIAQAALRLCRARTANLLRFDGSDLHVVALASTEPGANAAVDSIFPRPAGHDTVAGRAVLLRRVVTIEDVLADAAYGVGHAAVASGFRSGLGVPLLRDGQPIGAIAIGRIEPGPLPPSQVALMQIFAEQAVIAIENTRLFNALQGKTLELEIASRHKSAFLANMSHELRTPLNAILGFTRIVQRETRGVIAPRQADNLDKILASARHLVGLINATLDLTRIEAGRIEITAGETPLAPLLDECVRSVEPLLADGVRLDSHVGDALPPIWVDAPKLHQIMLNLLGNAVKFTERGHIELRAAQRDGAIEIEVEDTGIGIPADKLEAVFEEFEQVDASHTRAHGGTGLGLAIGRRLARAMGGELTARSTLGVGSTFTLKLPLRWSEGEDAH